MHVIMSVFLGRRTAETHPGEPGAGQAELCSSPEAGGLLLSKSVCFIQHFQCFKIINRWGKHKFKFIFNFLIYFKFKFLSHCYSYFHPQLDGSQYTFDSMTPPRWFPFKDRQEHPWSLICRIGHGFPKSCSFLQERCLLCSQPAKVPATKGHSWNLGSADVGLTAVCCAICIPQWHMGRLEYMEWLLTSVAGPHTLCPLIPRVGPWEGVKTHENVVKMLLSGSSLLTQGKSLSWPLQSW